ncbi:MAG: hypothetical protein WC321_06105 [Candidatus Omnitrophota bacterium]|jgi:hypothetical protein
MKNSPESLITIGCLFILAAVVLKLMVFANPAIAAIRIAKPSSLLILANTFFILAVLLKK